MRLISDSIGIIIIIIKIITDDMFIALSYNTSHSESSPGSSLDPQTKPTDFGLNGCNVTARDFQDIPGIPILLDIFSPFQTIPCLVIPSLQHETFLQPKQFGMIRVSINFAKDKCPNILHSGVSYERCCMAVQ